MRNEPLKIEFKITSIDAEVQAIEIIPQILKDLPKGRQVSLLKYILERYLSGDDFGI